jgi:hypothetical protein
VRILDELEPGALYSLWRASVGQYVLDEKRKEELFADHIIWDDFPTQPGEVRSQYCKINLALVLSVMVVLGCLCWHSSTGGRHEVAGAQSVRCSAGRIIGNVFPAQPSEVPSPGRVGAHLCFVSAVDSRL